MEQNGKRVPYVGWLQFQFCRIGCPEGKSSVTLLEYSRRQVVNCCKIAIVHQATIGCSHG
jgi:hypothetical protein